ncbi:MAG: hypothetical protein B0D87_00205 [Candidatus Sedimenticola endophacoides]|nr:MAG: hypothetical protein B0D87_00205 [Candidatus Sedimenticola endophacoides]
MEEQTMLRLRQLGWVVKVWWIQRRGEGSELTDLAHLARDMGLELEALRDAWGREIRYQASDSRYQLISAGGDGRFDTGDDLRREGMFGS